MELIHANVVAKAAKLEKLGGENTARILMSLFQFDKINQIYARHYLEETVEFTSNVLHDAGIKYRISDEDLIRIPKSGGFILIGNHPYGGVEGLILLNAISKIRPDFKIMANFLFNWIDPLKESVFGVNPFENHKEIYSSFHGLKKAFTHVTTGHPLAIFPAGEVSTYQHNSKYILDRPWSSSMIRFIKNAGVPVIPVYFNGHNSWLFHFMGRIHPMLRTVKIPSELLNKQRDTIQIRIGNPISIKDQDELQDISKYGRYLRAKTYALSSSFETIAVLSVKDNFYGEVISMPISKTILAKEIVKITPQYQFFQWQNYSVYSAPSSAIPNITKEIGRLREITFREVGEGTKHSSDIDEFDKYYEQLFIWDSDQQRIVGGYRIGRGKEIIAKFGIKGFYTHTLFRMNKAMIPILSESIELGRSFIVKDYQRKPMSLFLLWKGILTFLMKNEGYKYLIGPVSISDSFTKLSQQLMIDCIKKFHFDYTISRLVKPRKPYVSQTSNVDTEILNEKINDLRDLDLTIKDIEMLNNKMPVLLRKYLDLGGKIVSFNVDPEFNNTVDGLLILELSRVSPDIIKTLAKSLTKS